MSVKDILADLEKKKFDVTLLSSEDSPCVVSERISTGCLVLDKILGGGLPVGRMTEIYGDNSTGKSLIAAQVAAVAQESGHIVAYVDTEAAVSLDIMKAVGVNVDELLYIAPDTVEDVFKFFEACIESKRKHFPDKVLVLIWDSIAATSVDMEIEAEFGKSMMGRHALAISQGMRKINRVWSKDKICALFLNQTREKIGIMFGDKVATFGGKAIGFYASVRVQLRLVGKIKAGRKVIGVDTKANVVKNKTAHPYQEAVLPIYFGHGIDDTWATLNYLIDNDYVLKAGQYITMVLGDEEIKFRRVEWPKLYDEYYQPIVELLSTDQGDMNPTETESVTEDTDD